MKFSSLKTVFDSKNSHLSMNYFLRKNSEISIVMSQSVSLNHITASIFKHKAQILNKADSSTYRMSGLKTHFRLDSMLRPKGTHLGLGKRC